MELSPLPQPDRDGIGELLIGGGSAEAQARERQRPGFIREARRIRGLLARASAGQGSAETHSQNGDGKLAHDHGNLLLLVGTMATAQLFLAIARQATVPPRNTSLLGLAADTQPAPSALLLHFPADACLSRDG
jgi:hypothetical protein